MTDFVEICAPSISLTSIGGPSRTGFRVFPPGPCGGNARRDSMFSVGGMGRTLSTNLSAQGSMDDSGEELGKQLPCSPLSTGGTCKTPGSLPDSPPHFFTSGSPKAARPRRSLTTVSNTARRRSVTLTPLKLSSAMCNANLRGEATLSSNSPTLMAPTNHSEIPSPSNKLRRISITGSPSSNSPRSPLSSLLPNMPNNVLEFLEGMPWLENAPIEVKTKLAGVAQVRLIHQGETIIRKSEQAKAIFFVARGLVEVVSEDGEIIYAEIGEGSIFGEIAVLFDVPRTCSCRAASNLLLLAVKKEDFLAIVGEHPELKETIVAEASSRLEFISNKTKALQSSSAIGKDFQMSNLAENLLSFHGFDRLDRQAINQVSLLMESACYKQSEVVLDSTIQKTYENLFMVVQGEVEIVSYATTECVAELSREVIPAGGMFGNVVAFYPDEPLPTGDEVFPRIARAVAACEVLKLPLDLFREYLTDNEDVAASLAEELGLGGNLPISLTLGGGLEEEEDPMGCM